MINTLIVGYGWWGKHIFKRLQSHEKFKVCGIVEPSAALHDEIKMMRVEIFTSLDSALKSVNLDAVILTSPNILHDQQILQVAQHGIHVFCEKPLSLDGTNAKKSIEICRENKVILGIGHERRFEPAVQVLKAMIDKEELGVISHAELAFSHNKLAHLTSESWRTTKKHAPAAGMTQMGIHLTDMLIHFFGKVRLVNAFTADRSLGWETGDTTSVHLQFESGITATVQALLNTPHFIRTHVFGSRKWVEVVNSTHPDTPGGKTMMREGFSDDDVRLREFEWSDSVLANLEAFADAILLRRSYPFSDFEMQHNIDVLSAIVKSSETNQVITLE